MPHRPGLIRYLIKSANQIDRKTQREIRALIDLAEEEIIIISQHPAFDFDQFPQILEAGNYLNAVSRSQHDIHDADAKRALLMASAVIHLWRIRG